jgi:hypothetical protein
MRLLTAFILAFAIVVTVAVISTLDNNATLKRLNEETFAVEKDAQCAKRGANFFAVSLLTGRIGCVEIH